MAMAVGTPQRCISSLAKVLLLSIRAALLVGPNIAIPSARKASTMPMDSGTSGPTTVMSTLCSPAYRCRPWISAESMGTFRAVWPVPALPGATARSETRGL